MSASMPRIWSLKDASAVQGSSLFTKAYGTGLDRVVAIRLSGSGVLAQILNVPSAAMIDLVFIISSDAAPGPRALHLITRQGIAGTAASSTLFYVLPRSGYMSTSGIGSHLL
jgi:hypothetical protein